MVFVCVCADAFGGRQSAPGGDSGSRSAFRSTHSSWSRDPNAQRVARHGFFCGMLAQRIQAPDGSARHAGGPAADDSRITRLHFGILKNYFLSISELVVVLWAGFRLHVQLSLWVDSVWVDSRCYYHTSIVIVCCFLSETTQPHHRHQRRVPLLLLVVFFGMVIITVMIVETIVVVVITLNVIIVSPAVISTILIVI